MYRPVLLQCALYSLPQKRLFSAKLLLSHYLFFLTDFCQTNINPCQNGGTCVSFGTSYQCQCLAGYTGNQCTTVIISEYSKSFYCWYLFKINCRDLVFDNITETTSEIKLSRTRGSRNEIVLFVTGYPLFFDQLSGVVLMGDLWEAGGSRLIRHNGHCCSEPAHTCSVLRAKFLAHALLFRTVKRDRPKVSHLNFFSLSLDGKYLFEFL